MDRHRLAGAGPPLLLAAALACSACAAPAGAGVDAPATVPTTAAPETTTPASAGVPATAPTVPADDSPPLPDLTARPITAADLEAMLPAEGPAGSEPVVAIRTNEDLVVASVLDPEDQARDIDRHRRLTGVVAYYPGGDAEGHVQIDLFADAEGASGWLLDTAEDLVKQAGGTHDPGTAASSTSQYPVSGIGQETVGLIAETSSSTETLVVARIGRLVVLVSIVRQDDADARVPARYLAEDATGRVVDVLLGTAPDPPASSGPEAFDFTFRRTVSIGEDIWTSTAEGTVSGGSVSCRSRLDTPVLREQRRLVLTGGVLWEYVASGSPVRRGAAGAVDRMLLDLCPAWPVDVDAAGLRGVMDGEPAAHELDGTAALGYRGTPEDLAAALGLDPDAITVEVFGVWIAEGTSWIVSLDLRLAGPAAALTDLIGPGYPQGTAEVHLVQQVGRIGEAGPVIPPG